MVFPLPYEVVLDSNTTAVPVADTIDWETLYHSSGAVLIGGLVALYLSGAAFMQVVLYWRFYGTADPIKTKIMVVVIWIFDLVHSAMICTANWKNLVSSFGDFENLDHITWSIAVTVALTASTTFFVHCFFSHRIHTLSQGNWYITGALVTLALVRLIAATVSTAEMIRLESFKSFVDNYEYVFTLGLSTSTALDIFITCTLCYYLRRRRSGLARMDRIIDTLTLYTVENGMLTCLTTAVSLICWVRMPNNLIFLGLHLAISKLYANSFLATLNARKSLGDKAGSSATSDGYALPVVFPSTYSPRTPTTPRSPRGPLTPPLAKPLHVNIAIERTIHREESRFSQLQDGVVEPCVVEPETRSVQSSDMEVDD